MIRATTQIAFTTPDVSRSLKRSLRIENSTIRYATKAKLMKMNHTTSQNDIRDPFPEEAVGAKRGPRRLRAPHLRVMTPDRSLPPDGRRLRVGVGVGGGVGDDAAGGDRVHQGLVVPLVLIGIGVGELPDGDVEGRCSAEVGSQRDAVAGPGVG